MTTRRELLGLALLAGAGVSGTVSGAQRRDVIVVGGGIGGLSAALAAVEAGASVTLLEKNRTLGGDTLISGGTFNAVDPERQRPLGIEDSYELFARQIIESGEGYNDPVVARVLARESTVALLWLESHGMRFLPELAEIYGSGFRRSHYAAYPRGRGYIHCLSNACLNAGVDIRLGVRAKKILMDKTGAAAGISCEDGTGKRISIMSRKGLILASGGYAANRELLKKYAPQYAELPIDTLPSSTGDMLIAGMEIGADVCNLGFIECVPGAPPDIPYQVRLDYNAGDVIMVNAEGCRFTNEDGKRREIAQAIFSEESPCFEVADQSAVDRMNQVNRKNLWRGFFAGAAWKDNNPRVLATKLGVPEAALESEIRTALDSGRFARAPFWGVRIHLRIHATLGGLRINEKAQVLDTNGKPISRLWAAGSITGNVHGINRLGANGLNCACAFGMLAGRYAAGA